MKNLNKYVKTVATNNIFKFSGIVSPCMDRLFIPVVFIFSRTSFYFKSLERETKLH